MGGARAGASGCVTLVDGIGNNGAPEGGTPADVGGACGSASDASGTGKGGGPGAGKAEGVDGDFASGATPLTGGIVGIGVPDAGTPAATGGAFQCGGTADVVAIGGAFPGGNATNLAGWSSPAGVGAAIPLPWVAFALGSSGLKGAKPDTFP